MSEEPSLKMPNVAAPNHAAIPIDKWNNLVNLVQQLNRDSALLLASVMQADAKGVTINPPGKES